MFRCLVFVFLQIFIFQLNFAFAQSKTQVFGESEQIGNKTESIENIEKRALKRAKEDALSNSGIQEHIKSTSSRRTETNRTSDSENISFNTSFTSSFFSEMQGAVTEYEIVDEKHSYREDLPVYYVKIRATVIKYEKDPDYNFKAIVEGLDPVYTYDEEHVRDVKNPKDGCAVRFNFINTKDSYLTIFVTWDDSVSLPFQNDQEEIYNSRNSSFKFNKKEKHSFGEHPIYWFDSKNKKNTTYTLIFVFHKEERLFIEDPNTDNMLKWIYEIPRDLRYIDTKDFTVYNNKQ